MPLHKPRRLPRQYRRKTSRYVSAVAKKRHAGAERLQRRRKERWMRYVRKTKRFWTVTVIEIRMWLAIGAAALVCVTIGILLFSPYFHVREINVRRMDARVDIDEVQQILSPLFHERLLFVTRAEVKSLLTPAIPDLDNVEISKEYPSSLTVTITLDPLSAKVLIDPLGSSGSIATGSGRAVHQYITRDGYLVESPIELGGGPYPLITLTDWSIVPSNRTKVFDPDDLRIILLAGDVIRRDYGLSTEKITYFIRAREFHIQTEHTELWFDLESTLPEQFQRFRQFLAEASFDDAKEYIDLRIEDTIVFK